MAFQNPFVYPEHIISCLKRLPEVVRFEYNPNNNFLSIIVTEWCDFSLLVTKLRNIELNMSNLFLDARDGHQDEYMQYDSETNTFVPSSREEVEIGRHEGEEPKENLITPAGVQAHELVGQIGG